MLDLNFFILDIKEILFQIIYLKVGVGQKVLLGKPGAER